MTDQININYIDNVITIHVRSLNLSEMTNDEIMAWVSSFIERLENAKLKQGVIGDDIEFTE